jgi:hypothetical protein
VIVSTVTGSFFALATTPRTSCDIPSSFAAPPVSGL